MEQAKIVNYYAIYHLDRTESREELKKKLRSEQGRIKAMMSGGALNQEFMEKLTLLDNRLRDALKMLKTDESRAKYDKMLDEAILNGTVDTEQQSQIQNILDEIKKLFENYDFPAVIAKCREALNENILDAEIFGYLARSYEAIGRTEEAVQAAEEGIEKNPDNTFVLSLGCRMTTNYGSDVSKFKSYLDRLNAIDTTGKLAAVEQGYYYMKKDSVDRAFALYDEFIAKHPTDEDFRRDVAYDIIGYAATMYKDDPSGELDIKAITSEEDYNLCLKLARKAAAVYNNDTVREFLTVTESFGELDPYENPFVKKTYREAKIFDGAFVFFGVLSALAALIMAIIGAKGSGISGFFLGLLLFGSTAGMFYLFHRFGSKGKRRVEEIEKMLHRPMWQVYKYEFYGEHELSEIEAVEEMDKDKAFIISGTKAGLKVIWEIIKGFMN